MRESGEVVRPMISLSEVRRAKEHWGCGWFVAWNRLRCRRAYWGEHETLEPAAAPDGSSPERPAAGERDSA
jgi:hypothetical protein